MINVRMNAPTEPSSKNKLSPKIIVVGVGGAGCNAVNNMITTNVKGVNFLVCNTDAQALNGNLAEHKVQLGAILTEGLGAGAKPEIGRAAAEESLEDVMQYLEDANMAFITAGMGGGTGTGAASVIAKACRERGILTVGVVTKPFHFEGSRRMKMAEEGLSELQNYVDTLIIIPNQNLFRVVNDKTTFSEGFKMADSVLQSAVRGVTDLIVMPGLINLDFADIRSVMQEMGKAVMGAGEATGDNRAQEAAEKAISNPLLDDVSMKGAKGVIVNITGGYDMTLFEVDEACNRIRDEVDPDANIIFGSTFDETMEGTIRVSVVATGIESAEDAQKRTNHRQSGGGFQVDRTKPVAGSASRNSLRQSDAATMNAAQGRAASSMSESSQAPRMSAGNAPKAVVPNYPATAPQTVPMNAYSQDRQMAMEEQTQRQAVGTEFAPAMNGAMKGMRVGDSYIPPQPADPHMIANGAVNDATIGAAHRHIKPPPMIMPETLMLRCMRKLHRPKQCKDQLMEWPLLKAMGTNIMAHPHRNPELSDHYFIASPMVFAAMTQPHARPVRCRSQCHLAMLPPLYPLPRLNQHPGHQAYRFLLGPNAPHARR